MQDNYSSRREYSGPFGRYEDQDREHYRNPQSRDWSNERGSRRRGYRVERGAQEHTFPPNRRMPVGTNDASGMDDLQRWVSGVGGAALLWYGWQQHGFSRWPLTALGAGLLYQGVAGNNLLDHIPVVQEIPIVREMTSEPTQLRIRKSLTVNKPAEELYAYWRDLSHLPSFMSHVKSVQELGNGRSHWVVQVLNDMELEWDAQITVDRPNEMIAWETLPEADIQNRGYVKFIPTARGTEVSVSMDYDPPGAAAGRLAGRAVKFITEQQVKEDIRNFKRLMETGEIPTTKGQPAAREEAWQQNADHRARAQWQNEQRQNEQRQRASSTASMPSSTTATASPTQEGA